MWSMYLRLKKGVINRLIAKNSLAVTNIPGNDLKFHGTGILGIGGAYWNIL